MQYYAFADTVVRHHERTGLPITWDSVFEFVEKYNVGALTEKLMNAVRSRANSRNVVVMEDY